MTCFSYDCVIRKGFLFPKKLLLGEKSKAVTRNALQNVSVLSWATQNQLADRDLGQP
jgi:hypothetical protein